MAAKDIIARNWESLRDCVDTTKPSLPELEKCAALILESLKAGRKVMAAGNGGSACDALHLCEELVGRYKENRFAIPALCLNSDVTAITCIGNDFGFDAIFSRQVEALGQPGDVLVLFTTSGNSHNLVRAATAAKAKKIRVIAFTGRRDSKLAEYTDLQWVVPTVKGARIQEMHTWALHVVLEIIEAELFGI